MLEFDDGSESFVKRAVDDLSSGWLRDEHRLYSSIQAGFMPGLLGYEDEPLPLLVLECLSGEHWPPPWRSGDVTRVLATLTEIAVTPVPPGLPELDDLRDDFRSWTDVVSDPGPVLSLGLFSRDWLDAALPTLSDAAARAQLAGSSLVHLDVRSDNICIRGDRALLIDWNLGAVGNALVDVAFWAPSLASEGGPPPDDVISPAAGVPELAAFVAGYFASRAGLPPPPTAPRVRPLQLAQLSVALPWAAAQLGLPPPS